MATILIVDDSPTDAYIVKSILESQGYQTAEAASGEEGIRKAREIKPNLVIMDVVMPGAINGFKATREITKGADTKSIPVLVVSSKSMESDIAWAKMQGAKGFLVKPVNQNELLSMVKELLG
jgi:twitching motility two-component system response regulator PilH